MIVLVLVLLIVVIGLQTSAIFIGDRHNRIGLRVIETANAMARDSFDCQLRQIHTLVNSDMTSARMGELSQTIISLALMNKLMDLEVAAGRDVTEDATLITQTEERIEDLRSALADRRVQQAKVETQQIAEMQRGR